MIIGYGQNQDFSPQQLVVESSVNLQEFQWIDLIAPTKAEEDWIENNTCLDIPTQEEMREIELSSRLYTQNGALYMTATMVAHSQSSNPQYDAITFVLTEKQLITIRYIEPQAFRLSAYNLQKFITPTNTATVILLNILEAAVDRLADSLEFIGHHLDNYSATILQMDNPIEKPNY